MKIWEILKKENIGKKYKTKIYGLDKIVKVDYDCNTYNWLTVKNVENHGLEYPLDQLYLEVILKMDFEEI